MPQSKGSTEPTGARQLRGFADNTKENKSKVSIPLRSSRVYGTKQQKAIIKALYEACGVQPCTKDLEQAALETGLGKEYIERWLQRKDSNTQALGNKPSFSIAEYEALSSLKIIPEKHCSLVNPGPLEMLGRPDDDSGELEILAKEGIPVSSDLPLSPKDVSTLSPGSQDKPHIVSDCVSEPSYPSLESASPGIPITLPESTLHIATVVNSPGSHDSNQGKPSSFDPFNVFNSGSCQEPKNARPNSELGKIERNAAQVTTLVQLLRQAANIEAMRFHHQRQCSTTPSDASLSPYLTALTQPYNKFFVPPMPDGFQQASNAHALLGDMSFPMGLHSTPVSRQVFRKDLIESMKKIRAAYMESLDTMLEEVIRNSDSDCSLFGPSPSPSPSQLSLQ